MRSNRFSISVIIQSVLLAVTGTAAVLILLGDYMLISFLVFLGIWILIQLLSGAVSIPGAQGGGGIAFFAHIGGFFAGLILIRPFMVRRRSV